MSEDDRFVELLDDLRGFYRVWLVYLGLETGLLAAVRAASDGLTSTELAAAAGCASSSVDTWARAAYAYGLLDVDLSLGPPVEDDLAPAAHRFRIESDLATMLLDEESPEFLGGQFAFSVGASLDHGGLVQVLRSGLPHPDRSTDFHRSVEKLNAQDTTLFLEQAIPALPDLRQRLEAGMRVLDVACGGAGWLLAVTEAFPAVHGTGIEFDPEWLTTARVRVAAAGRGDRITIEERDPAAPAGEGTHGLVYFQDVLHELAEPTAALSAAWRAVEEGGWLIVLDWCLPTSWGEYRTPHGELLWGYQLDELYQGTSLLTRSGFDHRFDQAGLPLPTRIELDAGATLFVLQRDG